MLVAAAGAALLAVALVGGYSTSVQESYGSLRPVVVLTRSLGPGQVISPKVAAASLETRQVPTRFAPFATLRDASPAIGMEVAAPLPAGSYLTTSALRVPGSGKRPRDMAGPGRHAVEISVAGGGALSSSGKVDVLVTSDDRAGGGSTRIVARGVPLIAVGRSGQSDAGPGLTSVTMGLTRRQAIRLINAESFARRITVLPRAGR